MQRLTKELLKDSYVLNPQENIPNVIVEGMIYNKLGKLEDIEEELGCPIEVYVKLHKIAKIYDEQGNPLKIRQVIDENIVISTKKEINGYKLIPLNCYKKTWWIKEDRSE